MKNSSETYKFAFQKNGIGHIGLITLKVSPVEKTSNVIDNCTWKMGKATHPNFQSNGPFEDWKLVALNIANQILDLNLIIQPVQITILDVAGHVLNTCPADIAAATLIGFLDQINKPVQENKLEEIKNIIWEGNFSSDIPEIKNWL